MKPKSGFTLIELSMVLVIVGLIVGGVLVGQDMIRAAEVRNVMEEKQQIDTALNTFRLKYNCYPGDCLKATTFWGTDASCPNTPANTTPKEATCNGNGDRKVGDYSGTGSVVAYRYEWFRFWQHLGNAGLIEGQFSGTSGTSAYYDCGSPVNCLQSALDGRWSTQYINYVGSTSVFPLPAGNYVTLGKIDSSNNNGNYMGLLTPMELQQIDQKFDDGKPGLGKVIGTTSTYPYSANCSSSSTAATATYRTDLSDKNCRPYIRLSDGPF